MELEELTAETEAHFRAIAPREEDLPKVSYDPSQIHGWREVGQFYSCIPDPVYPWDPEVVRRIQKFVPDVVPMWVHWVFKTPPEASRRETVVFGRHALGRRLWNPGIPLQSFPCTMPQMPCQGLTFERPNQLWFVHDGAKNEEFPSLPGNYLGFDDSIVERAKDSALGFTMTEKEFVEFMVEKHINTPRRAQELRKAQIHDEMSYRDRDLKAYAKKQLDKISDVEMEEFLRSAGNRERERKPTIVVP